MINFTYEISKLQKEYKKVTKKDINLVGDQFYTYINNYLFSIKDEPIKKVLIRIFNYYLFTSPTITFQDKGIAYELRITTLTGFKVRLVLVGASIIYYYGVRPIDFILFDSNQLDGLSQSFWPLNSDGSNI